MVWSGAFGDRCWTCPQWSWFVSPVAETRPARTNGQVCHSGRAPHQSGTDPAGYLGSSSRPDEPAALLHPAEPGEGREVGTVERAGVERRDEVGTTLGGPAQRLVAPPPLDAAVVPREQHLGHVEPGPLRRLRVDGVLEEPGRTVRLLDERLGVPDDTGEQPRDRLDQHERRDLA